MASGDEGDICVGCGTIEDESYALCVDCDEPLCAACARQCTCVFQEGEPLCPECMEVGREHVRCYTCEETFCGPDIARCIVCGEMVCVLCGPMGSCAECEPSMSNGAVHEEPAAPPHTAPLR